MLGPEDGNHFLNSNPKTNEDYFPWFRQRFADTKADPVKRDNILTASDTSLVNTMRDQTLFPLVMPAKKGDILPMKALAEHVLILDKGSDIRGFEEDGYTIYTKPDGTFKLEEVPSGEFDLFPLFEVVAAGTSNHEQQLKSRVLVPVQRVRTEARVGGQIIDHAAAQFPARQRNIMTTQRYRRSDDWKFGSCLGHCEIVRRMNSKKLLRKEPKLRTIFFPP
jgi:hypothetical protein